MYFVYYCIYVSLHYYNLIGFITCFPYLNELPFSIKNPFQYWRRGGWAYVSYYISCFSKIVIELRQYLFFTFLIMTIVYLNVMLLIIKHNAMSEFSKLNAKYLS